MRTSRAALAWAVALFVSACGPSPERKAAETKPPVRTAPVYANVNAKRLSAPDDNSSQWMTTGRNYGEQRFSPLTKIFTENVAQLGLAWYGDFDTHREQQSTPIVIDGVMYVSTAWSKVYAYDARTGRERWKYDPKVSGEWGGNACCDVVNRGVAAWNGKIYLGTLDGRLIAIDASTGKAVWETQTTETSQTYSITGAPRIADGRVFIGQAGSHSGQRGYISAYDAETGKLDWRWYIVPGNPRDGFENEQMELAARTWRREWWKTGGGGSPADAITYDPVADLVIVGTGNGTLGAEVRSSDNHQNLYLSSMVALYPDTGEYAWHYQMKPRESRNYSGTQQITIADLYIGGKQRHVAMQASNNGYFYVVNADTGKLISAKPFVPGAIPTPDGAHSWHPMSFNPQTGLAYIPALYSKPGDSRRVTGGMLLAWDPVSQQEIWKVVFEGGSGGGTLSTAGGLVFQGNSRNQEFVAYRAENGERLWSMPTQAGVIAGAVSYLVDGEQYIAVVAGARVDGDDDAPNCSRILVFKLGGTARLPVDS
ncbi:MAG: PQQ-binding-like beta-propeller repeat protein [Gammaproteobacteria bacterium]